MHLIMKKFSMMKINTELVRTNTNSEWLEFVLVRPGSLFITDFFIPAHGELLLFSVLSVFFVTNPVFLGHWKFLKGRISTILIIFLILTSEHNLNYSFNLL